MGSPLSSFLAEAVMQDLEKRSVTNNNGIKTWNRKTRLTTFYIAYYKQYYRKYKIHERRRR
jgi:hypothetical protein